MIVRVLALTIVIAGIASLLMLSLPELTGLEYRQTVRLNPETILVDGKSVYLVASTCINVPKRVVYSTLLEFDVQGLRAYTTSQFIVVDKSRMHVNAYIYSGWRGCIVPMLAELQAVNSPADVDRLIIASLKSYNARLIKVYRGLSLDSQVPLVSTGVRFVGLIVVARIPGDSFKLNTPLGVLPGSLVVRNLSMAARGAPASGIVSPRSAMIASWLKGGVVIVVRQLVKPNITPAAVARAASLTLGGVLLLAVDASYHPEYYRGRLGRLLQQLARLLGFGRGRRG